MEIFRKVLDWYNSTGILNFSTLFAVQPPEEWKYQWVYAGWLVLFTLVLMVSIVWRRTNSEIRFRLVNFCFTQVLTGLFLAFFRYQGIPLLGMDAWRFFQIVWWLVWAILFASYLLRTYPRIRLAEKVANQKNKYLPEGNRS
jgi:hypothetical protein